MSAGNTPYVKRAEGLVKNELSDNLSGWPRHMIERLATECVRIVEEQRAAAGYHVVQEGQAVVDDEVFGVESADDVAWADGNLYRLRPLTDESPTP